MARRTAALTALTGTWLLVTASAASADVRADWHMDEASSQMVDASGYGNHSSDVVDVTMGLSGVAGSAYGFNGSTSYVRVPESDALDPFGQDIKLGAWVMLSTPILDDSYDIIRKGLASTPGGDYKMEIKNVGSTDSVGKLLCLFKGSQGSAQKIARPNVANGAWHRVECTKTNKSVVARVDGRAFAKTATVGSIASASDVLLGSKVPGDDVLHGLMDEASIDIAR